MNTEEKNKKIETKITSFEYELNEILINDREAQKKLQKMLDLTKKQEENKIKEKDKEIQNLKEQIKIDNDLINSAYLELKSCKQEIKEKLEKLRDTLLDSEFPHNFIERYNFNHKYYRDTITQVFQKLTDGVGK